MDLKNECLVTAKEIADILLRKNQFKNNGLHSGRMGAIIYLYICYEYWKVEDYKSHADEWIIELLNKTDEYQDSSFCEGNSGIAWGIEFLNKESFIQADINYLLEDFDCYLINTIENDISICNNDFRKIFV